jgi:AraC-like DNA-binding protein
MTASSSGQYWLKRSTSCPHRPTFAVRQQSAERVVANDFLQGELVDQFRRRKVGQDGHSRTERIVRDVKDLLEQHAAKTTSMKQLSARYQLGEKHLYRIFRELTGLSPYQYYLQFRIHRAEEMLRDTTLLIKEIAVALQFETSFHFSTFFKKKTGMSPSEWRSGGAK